ncbi:hypothetical protein MMC25_004714 [Agyrium rufum]|nr:hypothetical protein [Agyrium rufum]
MLPPFDYFEHRRACNRKQAERATRIANLPAEYHSPVTAHDREILDASIETLVRDVHEGTRTPIDFLRTYGKVAIKAHAQTNCLTEIMIPEAERWAIGRINTKGPLAGIPISMKDTVVIGGYDASVGYSCNTGRLAATDGPIARLLKDAGAIPYVKTNVPTTLLSFESSNDVWGRCTNPHNDRYSPGGSTGGESALLAYGGSRIGIGTDVAGSVRVPAHFCGIYSLRCSTGRWPKMGMKTSMPGQEGIPSVFSPMARTLDDLVYFSRSILSMETWTYDHTVHPIQWRESQYSDAKEKKTMTVGFMRSDGVVPPTPAVARALEMCADALSASGHMVIEIHPPSPLEALKIASQLLNADGCATFLSFFRSFETNDPGAAQMSFWMLVPKSLKYVYYLWIKYIRRDLIWADLLWGFQPKSVPEQWKLVARREAYKAEFHEWWNEKHPEMDFFICPVNATPAVPHRGMKDAVSSCGYTFLFNLLDYSTAVIPVTKVDSNKDILKASSSTTKLNAVARGAYKDYDAVAMAGLPIGVQIVGKRLQEERVLAWAERLVKTLKDHGIVYQGLNLE